MAAFLLLTGIAARGDEVDFEQDIRPLLQRRCLRCHGDQKQQGGLRLDTRAAALEGGESGRPVLNAGLEENELWRRVASPTAEVRMPLEGPPLTADELSLVRRWVEAGADWPDAAQPVGQASPVREELDGFSQALLWLDQRLHGWDVFVERLRPTLWVGLASMAMLMILARAGRAWQQRPSTSRWRGWLAAIGGRITSVAYVLVLLGMVISGAIIQSGLYQERQEALTQQVAKLQQQVAEAHAAYQPTGELVRLQQPLGVRRTYYRGNDERSPELFNGGYYRTATIDLTLIDSSGQTVDVGHACPGGPLELRLEIRRAASAAPELFTDAVARRAFLTPKQPDEPITDRAAQVFAIEIVEPGEYWRATVPLGEISASGSQTIAGRWYVIQGDDPASDRTVGTAHYGIAYDLRLERGVLQPESDLWMGALMPTGNMIVTPPGRIHASEWLDFRPIPEIEGTPTADPELLGTPEHLPHSVGKD